MKKSTRMLCGIIAILLVLAFVGIAVASIAMADTAAEKSETVYITANTDGSVQSVLSSVYVTNPKQDSTVTDETTLTEIKNIGGSEAPKKGSGNSYTFKTDGEDVSYQGSTDKTPPVAMQIAYQLNGKTVQAEELAGKSGKVKITVSYQNNHTKQVTVKEEALTLYTPFTVVTMINLDESFSNVKVINAKTMAEAGMTTVTATTFPGLAFNLATDAKDRLAESFSVEADVTAFELDGITAIIMTGIVDSEDISDLDDLEDMITGIDEMGEAGDKLYDGTESLYRGVNKLYNGTNEYVDGIYVYRDGVKDAANGAQKLHTAAMQVADGAAQLNSGINRLSSSISGAGSSVSQPSVSIDQAAMVGDIASILGGYVASENINAVAMQIAGAMSGYIQSAATQVGTGIQSQLSGQMSQLSSGISQLQSGAAQLQNGTIQLTQGVGELTTGVNSLYNGAVTLGEEGRKLVDGVGDLKSGVNKLRKGVKELNEEGLQELAGNTKDMSISLERRGAVVQLGKDYQTFTGKRTEDAGSVKFVYQTESIYQEKPLVEETPAAVDTAPEAQQEPPIGDNAEEPGFFQRIWNWLVDFFTADAQE